MTNLYGLMTNLYGLMTNLYDLMTNLVQILKQWSWVILFQEKVRHKSSVAT